MRWRPLAAAFAALALAPGVPGARAEAPAPPPKPTVILITLDTTRLDHLGFAGYAAAATPTLDRLAASGTQFESAQAHVPLTLPSHANILTGNLPGTLNLRVNGLILNPTVPTLATRLKEGGYRTAAVVSSTVLARTRGLGRSFDSYDDKMTKAPRGGGEPEERRAAEVTDAALQAARAGAGPLFLWVHYYDPHFDYAPPDPFARQFQGRGYDGEIAYMDAEIGRLLEGLKGLGLLEDALVVAVGDHGEGLGDHGERQHGVFLYNYALRVPLVISWPGRVPAGKRVGDLCGLSDLFPTVLDLLGLPAGKVDGRSLAPLLRGGTLAPKVHYAESYHGFFTYGWSPLRALLTPQWKYIEAPKPELYRWPSGEAENLLAAQAQEGGRLRRALAAFPSADADARAEVEALLRDPSNAEALRSLVSLGYLSGTSAAPPPKTLLDPKDAIGIEEEVRGAQDLMLSGQSDQAEAKLLAILKRNPQNVPALSILGGLYLKAGKLDKARVCFEEEVWLKPQLPEGHLNLGTTFKRLGDRDRAEKSYRAALAVDPRMAEAAANLARLLGGRGRSEEASAVAEAALKAGAESADLYFETGLQAATRGDMERARFAFTRTIGLDPTRHEALANLGRIAFQAGRIDEAISYYGRAVRLAPREATYFATLGSLYLNGKSDPRSALRAFRQALAADPYGPQAQNLREIIAGLEAAEKAPQ